MLNKYRDKIEYIVNNFIYVINDKIWNKAKKNEPIKTRFSRLINLIINYKQYF